MWHALSDVDLANSVQFLLLDTGLAICYCKFINSGKGAQAKYRFVWAFLYPWIAAVGNIGIAGQRCPKSLICDLGHLFLHFYEGEDEYDYISVVY